MSFFATSANSFAEALKIRKTDDEKVLLIFEQPWAFDLIKLPAVWPEVWGNGVRCNAAAIQVGGMHFVVAATESAHLDFVLPSPTDFIVKVTPLSFAPADPGEISKGLEISAVAAHIKKLENSLERQIDEIIHFNKQNNCFSCHTSFPLALACNEALKRGYNINPNKIEELADTIINVQKPNGTFYFPMHPDYGIISTSLCAGAILANLSSNSASALAGVEKIFRNLPGWLDIKGLPKTDFFFKPVFIGQISSALFETQIISTLYQAFPDKPQNEQLRHRLLRMQNWAGSLRDEPVYRKLILLTGLPYLIQFDSSEKEAVVEELKKLIADEPEGKRADVRALARMALQKISPQDFSPEDFKEKPASAKDQIWHSLEEIVSFSPFKANKIIKSVDMTE